MSRSGFMIQVGVTPIFRNLSPASLDALAGAFEAMEVVPGPFHVAESSPGDVFILGEGTEVVAVDVLWEGDEPWQAVSRLRRGAVIGSQNLRSSGSGASSGLELRPAEERFEVVHSGTIWRLPAERVDQVMRLKLVGDGKGKGFQPQSTSEFIDVLHKWEWVDRSPDASSLVPRERLDLARAGRLRKVTKGEVLQRANGPSCSLCLVGPATAVRAADARLPESAPYWIIGRGGMFGYGARSPRVRAPIDLVVAHDGALLEWDLKALRSLGGGPLGQLRGSWIDAFMSERLAIYDSVLPFAVAMSSTSLLQGVSIGQILALLQGSTMVDWRVGGAPPVPLGVKAGMGVVITGEVVGYRLEPTIDHNSVQMLRFDPISVCRGVVEGGKASVGLEAAFEGATTRAFGSEECARSLLGEAHAKDAETGQTLPTHRWRARLPTRAIFVTADRIGEVIGVRDGRVVEQLPEQGKEQARHLLRNARAIENRHERAVADRIAIQKLDTGPSKVRDALNLLWVERTDGRSLGEADRDVLDALASTIAGPTESEGFGERTLLLTVTLGEGDETPLDLPADRQVVHASLPVGADPVADLERFLRRATGFANVILWDAPGSTRGRAIRHVSDTVMLLSWDPRAILPSDWAVETPYLFAQLVRAADGCSLPATAVRLHAVTEDSAPERGWASRHAALGRWARAATRRQIGIALGGGGAWGWAHVALLRAAYARGIPIDVVSGASFGSVAGAYFALGGPVGLRYAIEHDRDIQRAVNFAMATGQPLESFIDGLPTAMAAWADADPSLAEFATNIRALVPLADRTATKLPPVPLTHLPIPFFPVATELIMGSEHPRLTGSIGRGVRASGSLPPVFPVLREAGGNYADGGLSQNVPANVVETEGVSIIVASNIVPPPFLSDPRPVRKGVRGLITSLNPVSRTISMAVGVQTLFNRSGAVNTSMAPVVFQSAWTGTFLSQIDRADEIVSDTMANQRFWQGIDGLRNRWRSVQAPRPGVSADLGSVRTGGE